MIAEPNCSKRGCAHFRGVKQDGEDEATERVVCDAFPDDIPDSIAYGDDLHLEPVDGDGGVVYEPSSQD